MSKNELSRIFELTLKLGRTGGISEDDIWWLVSRRQRADYFEEVINKLCRSRM